MVKITVLYEKNLSCEISIAMIYMIFSTLVLKLSTIICTVYIHNMEGHCRQKSMYLAFILTVFILNAWLYVYMHMSCFHSFSSLFFILVLCYRVCHVMALIYTLIPVLFKFLFYSLLLFLILRCFVYSCSI